MDQERLNYDLALAYAKEHLRRLDETQLMDFAQYAWQVKHTFQAAYDCLQELNSGDHVER